MLLAGIAMANPNPTVCGDKDIVYACFGIVTLRRANVVSALNIVGCSPIKRLAAFATIA